MSLSIENLSRRLSILQKAGTGAQQGKHTTAEELFNYGTNTHGNDKLFNSIDFSYSMGTDDINDQNFFINGDNIFFEDKEGNIIGYNTEKQKAQFLNNDELSSMFDLIDDGVANSSVSFDANSKLDLTANGWQTATVNTNGNTTTNTGGTTSNNNGTTNNNNGTTTNTGSTTNNNNGTTTNTGSTTTTPTSFNAEVQNELLETYTELTVDQEQFDLAFANSGSLKEIDQEGLKNRTNDLINLYEDAKASGLQDSTEAQAILDRIKMSGMALGVFKADDVDAEFDTLALKYRQEINPFEFGGNDDIEYNTFKFNGVNTSSTTDPVDPVNPTDPVDPADSTDQTDTTTIDKADISAAMKETYLEINKDAENFNQAVENKDSLKPEDRLELTENLNTLINLYEQAESEGLANGTVGNTILQRIKDSGKLLDIYTDSQVTTSDFNSLAEIARNGDVALYSRDDISYDEFDYDNFSLGPSEDILSQLSETITEIENDDKDVNAAINADNDKYTDLTADDVQELINNKEALTNLRAAAIAEGIAESHADIAAINAKIDEITQALDNSSYDLPEATNKGTIDYKEFDYDGAQTSVEIQAKIDAIDSDRRPTNTSNKNLNRVNQMINNFNDALKQKYIDRVKEVDFASNNPEAQARIDALEAKKKTGSSDSDKAYNSNINDKIKDIRFETNHPEAYSEIVGLRAQLQPETGSIFKRLSIKAKNKAIEAKIKEIYEKYENSDSSQTSNTSSRSSRSSRTTSTSSSRGSTSTTRSTRTTTSTSTTTRSSRNSYSSGSTGSTGSRSYR